MRVKTVKILFIYSTEYSTRLSVSGLFFSSYRNRLGHLWVIYKTYILLNVQSKIYYFLKIDILHQWYWSYEYSDYESASGDAIEFDSYMVPESDLEVGQLRLLDVDNRLNVPVDTHARLVVQSTDVLHDFALPSAGIKIDAAPGRLNQTSLLLEREGTFYGQCSEICGVYHGFMPIAVDSLSLEEYLTWLSSMTIFFSKKNKVRKSS